MKFMNFWYFLCVNKWPKRVLKWQPFTVFSTKWRNVWKLNWNWLNHNRLRFRFKLSFVHCNKSLERRTPKKNIRFQSYFFHWNDLQFHLVILLLTEFGWIRTSILLIFLFWTFTWAVRCTRHYIKVSFKFCQFSLDETSFFDKFVFIFHDVKFYKI